MNDCITQTMQYADNVMTEIVLRNFVLEFLKDRRISLYDLVTDDGTHAAMISKCKQLLDELSVSEEELRFKQITQDALRFYGKDIVMEDIDMYDVVSMYTSAKRNMDKLRIVQFKRGKKSTKAPKFAKEIYLFHSIDEIIKSITSFKDNAVILCYIHDDEEASGSYFCYVMKNEDNIYLMGDMPEYAHPYQKFLSRCPSRDMTERINASFFPYSMAGVDLSCRYCVDDAHKDGEDFEKLGAFSDMQLEELLWNVYMLQFIKEKFFDNAYDCAELSYTGGMLNTPLIEKSETALALYSDFPSISIPVLTTIEETNDLSYGTERYPHESLGLFNDVVERFKDKVNMEECQMYSTCDTTKLITGKDSFGHDVTTNLLNVNINSFGTSAEINRKNKWAARFNFAKKINELAKKEHDERSGEINKWFREMVDKNLYSITERAIKDEFKNKCRVEDTGYSIRYSSEKDNEGITLTTKAMANNVHGFYYYPKNEHYNLSEFTCVLSGAKGTICLFVHPYDVNDLCNMFNITVDDVPEPIKNWCATEKRCNGNYLLGDYDPMDWVIRDYWYSMNFNIALVLSKSAYNKKRKEYGLPEDKFWNTELKE